MGHTKGSFKLEAVMHSLVQTLSPQKKQVGRTTGCKNELIRLSHLGTNRLVCGSFMSKAWKQVRKGFKIFKFKKSNQFK
jgi:hypothetical protein